MSRIDWVKKVTEIPEIARLLPEAEFYFRRNGPGLRACDQGAEEEVRV